MVVVVEEGRDDGGLWWRKVVGREEARVVDEGVNIPLCMLGFSPEHHAAKAATLLFLFAETFLKNTKCQHIDPSTQGNMQGLHSNMHYRTY